MFIGIYDKTLKRKRPPKDYVPCAMSLHAYGLWTAKKQTNQPKKTDSIRTTIVRELHMKMKIHTNTTVYIDLSERRQINSKNLKEKIVKREAYILRR